MPSSKTTVTVSRLVDDSIVDQIFGTHFLTGEADSPAAEQPGQPPPPISVADDLLGDLDPQPVPFNLLAARATLQAMRRVEDDLFTTKLTTSQRRRLAHLRYLRWHIWNLIYEAEDAQAAT